MIFTWCMFTLFGQIIASPKPNGDVISYIRSVEIKGKDHRKDFLANSFPLKWRHWVVNDPVVSLEGQLRRLISHVWDKDFWFGKKECVSFVKNFRIPENLEKNFFGCSLSLIKPRLFCKNNHRDSDKNKLRTFEPIY